MLKTLVWKESRELLPLVAFALLLQSYFVAAPANLQYLLMLSPVRLVEPPQVIPFVSDAVSSALFAVAGMFAVAVGLWQTMWESSRGTFQFLLHRPARRGAIFGAKLATGITVCLLVVCLPLVFYALWAATPGKHASPFHWSMTSWAWELCLLLPLVYLGAFLSGLRPARLCGSRFFPLAASLLAVVLMEALALGRGLPLVAMIAGLALETVFVLVILYVAATRDYS
jgi:hypothetical protein